MKYKIVTKAHDGFSGISDLIESVLDYYNDYLETHEGWTGYITFIDKDSSILNEVSVNYFDDAEIDEQDMSEVEELIEDYELQNKNSDVDWRINEATKSISAIVKVKEKQ